MEKIRVEIVAHEVLFGSSSACLDKYSGLRKRGDSWSPVRENLTPGSVAGAAGNGRPYATVANLTNDRNNRISNARLTI